MLNVVLGVGFGPTLPCGKGILSQTHPPEKIPHQKGKLSPDVVYSSGLTRKSTTTSATTLVSGSLPESRGEP